MARWIGLKETVKVFSKVVYIVYCVISDTMEPVHAATPMKYGGDIGRKLVSWHVMAWISMTKGQTVDNEANEG